jgi:hypothetical protein
VVIVVIAVLAGGHAAATQLSSRSSRPRAVVLDNDRISEVIPAAQGDTLLWSQNSRQRPRHFDAFLKEAGTPKIRLNPAGTAGYPGGIAGDDVIFQVVRRGSSNLRMYDVATEAALPVPGGINTDRWEWSPTISDDYILFGRQTRRMDAIVLHDRAATTEEVLASGTRFFKPGQVAGSFAVWQRCNDRSCDVYLYDAATDDRELIPRPGGVHWHFAPSVAPDGTVFFIRAANGCGQHLRFMRKPLGGPASLLTSIPDGREVASSYVDASGVDPILYYDRVNCENGRWGIYRSPT